MSADEMKTVEELPEAVQPPDPEGLGIPSFREARMRFETDYYSRVLQVAGGNVSLAARIAHKTRKEIYEAMRRLSLQLESFRAPGEAAASEVVEAEEADVAAVH
jgi:DNA-binding NtrC family response regulator